MAGRYDKVSGVWTPVKRRSDKISGVWTSVKTRYAKVSGIWKKSFTTGPYVTLYSNAPTGFVRTAYALEDRGTSLYLSITGYYSGASDTNDYRGYCDARVWNIPPGATVSFRYTCNDGSPYSDVAIQAYDADLNYLGGDWDDNARTNYTWSMTYPASQSAPGIVLLKISIGTTTSITRTLEIFEIKVNGITIFP